MVILAYDLFLPWIAENIRKIIRLLDFLRQLFVYILQRYMQPRILNLHTLRSS